MRLGLIAYGLDRPMTGIQRYTVELARALADRGEPAERFLFHAGRPRAPTPAGWRLVPMPIAARLPGLLALGSLWVGLFARRFSLDVLHDPSSNAPFVFAPPDTALVVTVHDAIPCIRPDFCPPIERWLYRSWLPSMLTKANRVLTVSRESESQIASCLGVPADKISVIPLGVSEGFRPFAEADTRTLLRERFGLEPGYILFTGAFSPRKNLTGLLEAFRILAADRSSVRLVLAGPHGKDRLPPRARRTADFLGDRVRFLGPVGDAELARLYAGARLFVFPSRAEGFGLPVLEAMACGTPVICSAVGELAGEAGKSAALTDPEDPRSLAEAMQSLLDDHARSRTLRQNGLRTSAVYTWRRTAEMTIQIYKDLWNPRRAIMGGTK